MATTRNFKSLGVWAENASTTIPPSPVTGTAYRNESLTSAVNEQGDKYNVVPDSADFNQKMFIISSFTDLMDRHGIVGWSDQVDYAPPAIVWASDNLFYFCLQANGPLTTVKDPIDSPDYWEVISSSSTLREELADETPGTEGARLVGYTGETVQDALDSLYESVELLHGMEVMMAATISGATGLAIGNSFNLKDNKAHVFTSSYLLEAEVPFSVSQTLVFVNIRGNYIAPGNYESFVGWANCSEDLGTTPFSSYSVVQYPFLAYGSNPPTSNQDFDFLVVRINQSNFTPEIIPLP